MFGRLVVAGGDATEMLQLEEEALDQIAFAVEPLAEAGSPFQIELAGTAGVCPVSDPTCVRFIHSQAENRQSATGPKFAPATGVQ